jgi:hypothetical protein
VFQTQSERHGEYINSFFLSGIESHSLLLYRQKNDNTHFRPIHTTGNSTPDNQGALPNIRKGY